MKYTPYPEQAAAIELGVKHLTSSARGAKLLITGPTGTGKSIVELGVQEAVGNSCWIITPREEIAIGMLQKLGVDHYDDLEAAMFSQHIATPMKLRNRLLTGSMVAPKQLIIDEAHHDVAETWRQLDLLSGMCPSLGLTATAYRGSPRSTRELLTLWGEPVVMVTYPEAERLGRISMPTYSMLPLVDDDTIAVEAGEFSVSSTEQAYSDRLEALAAHARQYWYSDEAGWTRPTIFAMPGKALCGALVRAFDDMTVKVVSADTPKAERYKIFAETIAGTCALAHVNVVAEGVDLPLRRLIDLAPCMSPLWFMQKLGRITRPTTDARPEYVCTNRNLLRHAYLLEGVLPPTAISEAEAAFGPSERSQMGRVIGLECVGKFKPTRVKSLSGVTCFLYNLSKVEGSSVTHYACLALPTRAPVWAVRVFGVKSDGTRDYGRWRKCEEPQGLKGFQSAPPAPLTPKMRAWWQKSAAIHGLDPTQEVDRKSFAALPIMNDLGWRMK